MVSEEESRMKLNEFFLNCRNSVYNENNNTFLLSKIKSSTQENDLTVPPNCDGYGRIRHFRRFISEEWGNDPLPIDPACKVLGLDLCDMIETQVFQIAACNVRCWYCFVPDELKSASKCNARWFSVSDMIDLFQRDCERISVLDLSGGNPELVPEWIYSVMKELERRKISDKVYLWSDDTLTTDYFFEYLDKQQIEYIKNYKYYGKVCCFKGFDEHSFSFNTRLPDIYFEKQFESFERYYKLGLDLYGYVTFTTDDINDLEEKIAKFIERLRKINLLLPLRVVPLKIAIFTPVQNRMTTKYFKAVENQKKVYAEWRRQLERLYDKTMLNKRICDVPLF